MKGEDITCLLKFDYSVYGGHGGGRKIGPPTLDELGRRIVEKYGIDGWMYEPSLQRRFDEGVAELDRLSGIDTDDSGRAYPEDFHIIVGAAA